QADAGVVADEDGAGVDPGAAAGPAFDVRGVEGELAHLHQRARGLEHHAAGREVYVEQSGGANHELDGGLDLGADVPGVVESAAGEERAEQGAEVVVGLGEDVAGGGDDGGIGFLAG